MIRSKKDLNRYLELEREGYGFSDFKSRLKGWICVSGPYCIWRYQWHLRHVEYYKNTGGSKLLCLYHSRRRNRLGLLLGFEIGPNCFEEGLHISHSGQIAVNYRARIGKNAHLVGCVCIGNKDSADPEGVPVIGDNLLMGFGSSVTGRVKLPDNVTVAPGAVVTHSVEKAEAGRIILKGIPARMEIRPEEK